MFSVTSAASSRALLSLAEMKEALGITSSDDDARLTTLGLQISDAISLACCVPPDGVTPPTLLKETIVETVRFTVSTVSLVLSRRFVASITSVVLSGTTVAAANYEVDKSSGVLRYLDDDDQFIVWPPGKLVVTYTAGFTVIPAPLKLAATILLRDSWSSVDRDPLVRGESFEGLGSVQYFSGALAGTSGFPPAVTEMLTPYRYGGL